eukprot:jgi/Mesen1/9121/ME000058S08615
MDRQASSPPNWGRQSVGPPPRALVCKPALIGSCRLGGARLAAASALLALLCLLSAAPAAAGWSIVQRKGANFMVDNKPFYANGFNTYWLMQVAAKPSSRHQVDDVLKQAAAKGLTICRTWAFADGAGSSFSTLQTSPGRFDESVFRALDYVVATAWKYKIRVILPFVNYWPAYGGTKQYVAWAKASRGERFDSTRGGFDNAFFTDPAAARIYRFAVYTLLNRRNTVTRQLYKNDPAVFAWELMNEPRCDGCAGALLKWTAAMARYVKSIDGRHMLTTGAEGFFGAGPFAGSNPDGNQYYQHCCGDFVAMHKLPQIDFATFHTHPSDWLTSSFKQQAAFVAGWTRAHQAAAAALKKPLLLGEFSFPRSSVYSISYNAVYDSARKKGNFAGALLWILSLHGHFAAQDKYSFFPDDPDAPLLASQSARLKKLRG